MTGNEFRELRKKAGMTQKQVAGKLGISFQAVQKWERTRGKETTIPQPHWHTLTEMLSVEAGAFIQRPEKISLQAIAKDGSIAVSSGRDSFVTENNQGVDITDNSSEIKAETGDLGRLTAREYQCIRLKRKYDSSESLLVKYIEKLLHIKKIYNSM